MRSNCMLCGNKIEQAGPGFDICGKCRNALHGAHGATRLRDLLNDFDFPVLVLDADAVVVGLNDRAAETYVKDKQDLGKVRCGELFDCENSRKPGGCGRTPHCVSCVLRRTVVDTHITGHAYKDIDSCHIIVTDTGTVRVHYLVTTEKLENSVLVKLVPRDSMTVN